MTDDKKPKAIILQSTDVFLNQTRNTLEAAGWDTVCESTAGEALARLKQEKENPFALFICDARLPEMKGEDILQTVKELSPLTQRMMMLPFDDPDILINAINKAKVNACIKTPCRDEDLVSLAENCLRIFEKSIKKTQLIRVTDHQNTQMKAIARTLKNKNRLFKKLIEDKKSTVLRLNSDKRRIEKQQDLSLSSFLNTKKIPKEPGLFNDEFFFLCRLLKNQFDAFTRSFEIDPAMVDYNAVYSTIFSPRIDGDGQPDKDPGEESESDSQQTSNVPQNVAFSNDVDSNVPEYEDNLETIADDILKKLFSHSIPYTPADPTQPPGSSLPVAPTADTGFTDEYGHLLDASFKLIIADDQVRAYLQKRPQREQGPFQPGLSDILNLLMMKKIVFGIIDDDLIETWLSNPKTKKILIATGEPAKPGKDGTVSYHFEAEYTNPGRIAEDGSIDFRDRGDRPFVTSGDSIATLIPPKEGKPGLNVFGKTLPVAEPDTPAFGAGPGTVLSKDGLILKAAIDGQPHLDKLGVISVSPELVIPGDVDYQTGNISFQGNIIVRGRVKEGFRVKGISLQAKELEGAIIDVTGDVKISAGITDSTISAQGNVYAKFINQSKISGYGNLVALKEIIDSDISISGKCINSRGHIIASRITAKLGIKAGRIGTPSSTPARLKVGIDDHVQMIENRITEALELSVSKSKQIDEDIAKLEDKDRSLYEQITDKAHIQDRAQLDIADLEIEWDKLEDAGDTARSHEMLTEIEKLKKTAREAEQELNSIFETQDEIVRRIKKLKKQLSLFEQKNKTLVLEKKALTAFAQKETPIAEVSVSKSITQGTVIAGPRSNLILIKDQTRCRIHETKQAGDLIDLYDMSISDLSTTVKNQ